MSLEANFSDGGRKSAPQKVFAHEGRLVKATLLISSILLASRLSLAVFYVSTVTPKTSLCTDGVYENSQQWRSLFPNGTVPLKGKALVSIPIGLEAVDSIANLIKIMGHEAFDYAFFAYDDTDWSKAAWFKKKGVSVLHTPRERKWTLYFDYLLAETVRSYSHVFLWDDDLEPTVGFDGEVLLQMLQAFDIGIAQPVIAKHSHMQFEGTSLGQRPFGLLHQVRIVEIMAPIYSTTQWSECLRPRMARDRGSGWGLDLWVQNYGDCVPEHIYSIGTALDHLDRHSLSKSSSSGQTKSEGNKYAADSRKKGWKPRGGLNGPFKDFGVVVDAQCHLSLVEKN
jgi:hypothetical protein